MRYVDDTNIEVFDRNPEQPCVPFPSFRSCTVEVVVGTLSPHSLARIHRWRFSFKQVFTPMDDQAEVYIKAAKPFIRQVLEGYNWCASPSVVW